MSAVVSEHVTTSGRAGGCASVPDVTVVIGVYNAMPYLTRCLKSVASQTLGPGRIEIIAVDDGSTDGSGDHLAEFAASSRVPMQLVRQPNSGGPSGPRNVGLGLAQGRYVFFMDADDYLGDEALERMVDAADRNGTDVVLGKVVGVNRGAPKSMWGRSLDRTDVFSSNIKFTLSAQKLFRRALLVQHDMRFDEGLRTGEDALFTMEAYLRAGGVSVVADYTCYYLVGREDGNHVTKSGSYTLRFDSARALMRLIKQHVPAGEKRDLLMVRPFLITLLPQFGTGFLADSEEVQLHKLDLARPLMQEYWTDGVARRLKVNERLRLHCVAGQRLAFLIQVLEFLRAKTPPRTVIDTRRRRIYLAYPCFNEAGREAPLALYTVTTRESLSSDTVRWVGKRRPVRRIRRLVRLLRTHSTRAARAQAGPRTRTLGSAPQKPPSATPPTSSHSPK